jgi:hypothetical protein
MKLLSVLFYLILNFFSLANFRSLYVIEYLQQKIIYIFMLYKIYKENPFIKKINIKFTIF